MDSFELNKIIGAILGTLLFVMGVGFLAEAIYEPAHGSGPGYNLPAAPEETGPGNTTPAVADIGTLLAAADPTAGEAAAKKCGACHDFTEGGPNKTGPNLYDVVERKIASHPAFPYSAALTAKAGDTWTYQNLNQWLISPKAWAPGTKMTYAGDKDDKDRANVIAYLSTLSKSPKPFPPPAAPQGGPAPTPEQTTNATSSVSPSDAVSTPSTTDANGSSSATPSSSAAASSASSAAPVSSEMPASSAPASSAPASSAAASSSAAQ